MEGLAFNDLDYTENLLILCPYQLTIFTIFLSLRLYLLRTFSVTLPCLLRK